MKDFIYFREVSNRLKDQCSANKGKENELCYDLMVCSLMSLITTQFEVLCNIKGIGLPFWVGCLM